MRLRRIAAAVVLVLIVVLAWRITSVSHAEQSVSGDGPGEVVYLHAGDGDVADYYLSQTPAGLIVAVVYEAQEYRLERYPTIKGEPTSTRLEIATKENWQGDVFVESDAKQNLWVASSDWFGFIDLESGGTQRVQLPDRLEPNPDGAVSNGSGRVIAMDVGADGKVRMGREDDGAITVFDPVEEAFSSIPSPPGIDVPGYFCPTTEGLVVAEWHQRTPEPVFAYVDYEGRTRSLPRTLGLWVSDGAGGAWFGTPGEATARIREYQDGVAVGAEMGLPQPYGDILAISATGDVWLVSDDRLMRYNLHDQSAKWYPLELMRVAPRMDPQSEEIIGGDVAPPWFLSTEIDDEGNLWFCYKSGFTRVGVAMY